MAGLLTPVSPILGYKPWYPWDKGLNVNDDYVDILCVPSATHVPCINESQNKVLGISIFVTSFF